MGSSDDSNVVHLDSVRKLREFESDPSVLYIELLWGERTFAVNAAIRDLEAMRRGIEERGVPLRDPETTFETQVIIDRMRWIANYLARQWGLEERVRPEDWNGDERSLEEEP